jgi:UDP-N-acetylglucosamine/UDP-N-acetylgalactosamine diphosphorylase
MTSAMTDADTRAFFASHNFFGLSAANVVFFQQGFLPCVDASGRFILEAPHRLALAPDGNGGIYAGGAGARGGGCSFLQR